MLALNASHRKPRRGRVARLQVHKTSLELFLIFAGGTQSLARDLTGGLVFEAEVGAGELPRDAQDVPEVAAVVQPPPNKCDPQLVWRGGPARFFLGEPFVMRGVSRPPVYRTLLW